MLQSGMEGAGRVQWGQQSRCDGGGAIQKKINVTIGRFEFNSWIIISSMINPQQNININISYNLNNPRTPKALPAKKINKLQKPILLPTPHCDIHIKLKNKHNDDHRKPDSKPPHDKKQHKKKPSNFLRNTFTPDLFNDRRFKTEGPSADLDAAKKDPKPKPHSKSTQPATKAIPGAISSKKSGSTKAVRSGRQGHVNSFLLINPKKPIEPPPKRKAESAFSRNDRVVSKLLNMSLLASELGGSRPITSERQSAETHSRTFKEYLSSMDMRLLRTMQDDVPIFARQGNSQDLVKSLMVAKGLSLEQLTSRVVIIQRAWRKALSQSVVHKYRLLFRQATDKLTRDPRSHQISAFAAESIASEIYNIDSLGPIASAVPLPRPETSQSLSDSSLENLPLQWAEEGRRRPHLDLARYQQLVTEGEGRRHFDPAALLDSFIEQSHFNKHWIENEFEPSAKPSRSSSAEKPSEERQPANLDDSLDESYDYNRIKYASPEEEHEMLERRIQELENDRRRERGRRREEVGREAEERPERERQEEREKAEDEEVIKGYLECGLGSFGLHVDQRILQLEQEREEERSDQEADSFSDEAIGARFEQANRSSLRMHPPSEPAPDPEPVMPPLREGQFEQAVEFIIASLIAEFAADISSILRRAAPPAPPRPQRAAGIPTGFAAVRAYLTQLIAFLQGDHAHQAKIVSNINKDIGPTSLEILSYLRPESEAEMSSQEFEEDGLFVVPAELFEEFEGELERRQREQQVEVSMRTKAYTNFWHRCIFESFNECLDYERPYGLDGKPYDWIVHRKPFREVTHAHLTAKLASAQDRLLDLTLMVGGVIFERPDGPFAQADFNEEEKHRINEERLSRILATELLESERSWTNYSDESAELLVELGRMLEVMVCDEAAIELQRVRRRRKLLPDLPL